MFKGVLENLQKKISTHNARKEKPSCVQPSVDYFFSSPSFLFPPRHDQKHFSFLWNYLLVFSLLPFLMPTTLRQMTCDISLLLIPLLILSNTIQTLGISGVNLETCTPAESNFYIDLVDMGMTPADDRVKEAFTKAAERWQAVIVGDLEGYAKGKVSDWFNGYFKKGKYNEAVDDLVIGYEIVPLDGKGGVLGQAGASIVRTKGADKGTTISGVMQFDADDFATMSSNDMLVTILHGKHCFELFLLF